MTNRSDFNEFNIFQTKPCPDVINIWTREREYQEMYRPGIPFADASILWTALGGDHNKVPFPV